MRLGVNVDHVATLRQARKESWPNPLEAALVAQRAGAHQITIHLREDRRHIQDHDVAAICKNIHIPVNLEMAAIDAMVDFALETTPEIVTLVPERREEITTEGGLDLSYGFERIRYRINKLQEAGIKVSVFIDPSEEQIEYAQKLNCEIVEFHTGEFAKAFEYNKPYQGLYNVLAIAAKSAYAKGITVAAGHGLTLRSAPLLKGIQEIEELNIGHALIADSIYKGLETTVRAYVKAISR